jgi:aminoglycoside phosphotransferase (APT) family kinase protein
MARSALTLAALATSAVAGLDLVGVQGFGSDGGGDFDAALLTGRDGRHWIVRVPRSERAEAEQSADLVALRALSPGVRARLPFSVSSFAGQAPVAGTRAVVSEFVYGTKVPLAAIGPELGAAIGRAIAAIHELPTSVVTDAGLPAHSAADGHRAALSLIDRAAATGLVPAALLLRWRDAGVDAGLWQYSPVVINGTLASDAILSAGDDVTGVLDWHGLRVGDPALDLQWLLGAADETVEAAFSAYAGARGPLDLRLRQRAALIAELEVARWLLHGTEVRSTEIVDDAVEMLSRLVDDVQFDVTNPITPQTAPILGLDEVNDLLAETQRHRRARSA